MDLAAFKCFDYFFCGEGGIRTLGTVTRTTIRYSLQKKNSFFG